MEISVTELQTILNRIIAKREGGQRTFWAENPPERLIWGPEQKPGLPFWVPIGIVGVSVCR